jgi:hypothetical protein
VVENIGSEERPWVIEAYLMYSSKPGASLILETQVNVVNGYANFSRLAISDVVSSFIIAYRFTIPQGVNE